MMTFPRRSVGIGKPLATQILCLQYINVLLHLKTILMFIISQVHLIRLYLLNNGGDDDKSTSSSSDSDRPSPCLVPLPPHVLAPSMNTKLPLVLYGQHRLEFSSEESTRNRACELLTAEDHEEPICVVCRNMVEMSHEIWELPNCRHVFHAECLDGWMDQGRFTCPLCRAKLRVATVDEEDEVLKFGDNGRSDDPWRKERMIYLFGEDFVMS